MVSKIEQFRLDTHLAQVKAEQFVMPRLEAFARFVGHVGREPTADKSAGQHDPCARWQAAMNTTGQKQDAGGIAARLRQ